MRKAHRVWAALCVAVALAVSGCEWIEISLTGTTPIPIQSSTVTPLINIASLPTLPRLAAEPSATPSPLTSAERMGDEIRYDNDPDLFRDYAGDAYDAQNGGIVRLRGTVSALTADSFILKSSGLEVSIKCDDGCFSTDRAKKLVAFSSLRDGEEVLVFGAADAEDTAKIIADLIVAGAGRAKSRRSAEEIYPPAGFYYNEYRLKEQPTLNPLSFETTDREFNVEENLTGRMKLTLAERNLFAYGMYGESYSSGTEFTTDENRAAGLPTRAEVTVYSNAYEFFSIWIPYVEVPYDQLWGILNYGGDWFLPMRLTVDVNPEPNVVDVVFSDRTIMSQLNYDKAYNYLRTFGHSIINSSLFYFYEREDGCGFALNRVDYPLAFDEIIFQQQRPYAELNPFYSDYLIGFFGKRGETWYYAEVTADEPQYW